MRTGRLFPASVVWAALFLPVFLAVVSCAAPPSEPPPPSMNSEGTGGEFHSQDPGSIERFETQEACERAGGRWEQLGMIGVGCNLPTSDGGMPCGDTNECEGLCLPADPRIMMDDGLGHQVPDQDYLQEANQSDIPIEGVCSAFESQFGCIIIIEDGSYVEICID